MSLQLSTEQSEFRAMLRRFFEAECGTDYLKRRIANARPSDPELRAKLQSLDLGAFFGDLTNNPSLRELAVVAFESGRVLLTEPLVDAIMGGPFLFKILDADKGLSWQPPFNGSLSTEIAEGSKTCLLAMAGFAEPLQFDLRGKGSVLRASGVVPFIPAFENLDYLVLPLKIDNRRGLWLANLKIGKEQKVNTEFTSSLDLSAKLMQLEFQNTAIFELKSANYDQAQQCVRILKASELAGLCERVVSMTREYVSTRKQFGVPVGGFQAVQHKLAELHLKTEAMAALSNFAAWAFCESPNQAQLASTTAISFALSNSPRIVEAALQLHGGIGFTWEYELHLFLRRTRSIVALFQNEANLTEDVLAAAV